MSDDSAAESAASATESAASADADPLKAPLQAHPLAALHALLGTSSAAPVMLTRLDVRDWGREIVFAGTVGDQPFTLSYSDCREIRWRIYVQDRAESTRLVSFAPGRDQQRSPAQFLSDRFGLSLYYGNVSIDSS